MTSNKWTIIALNTGTSENDKSCATYLVDCMITIEYGLERKAKYYTNFN